MLVTRNRTFPLLSSSTQNRDSSKLGGTLPIVVESNDKIPHGLPFQVTINKGIKRVIEKQDGGSNCGMKIRDAILTVSAIRDLSLLIATFCIFVDNLFAHNLPLAI